MLISAVFVPGAPALVPEVSGVGSVELDPVRSAVADAVAAQADLSNAWWAVGPDDGDASGGQAMTAAGSFGGFGVDREVSLTPDPAASGRLPTSMLVAGWMRELTPAAARVVITPQTVPADAGAERCRALGERLAESAAGPVPTALLIVGDGAIHLGERAPGGGLDPDAAALQREIDAALAGGDPASLRALDWARCERWGVDGRGAWEVAAAALPGPMTATVHYSGAPLGVGYNVVGWRSA
ncbi:MAG: hypothetical protein QM728_08255 [Gordonia sp. (in: high G+C Gram-positive bacteria)]|uniref:hypothetical protein n=1 Tax=Gordonia sp. (in: high G+C Gram-positive bacteria) TaxID=84139 RepID=UPI0039E433E8